MSVEQKAISALRQRMIENMCLRKLSEKTQYNTVEKVEGIALIDADTVAVINDNDFGVAGISSTRAPAPTRCCRITRRNRRCLVSSTPAASTRRIATT